MRQTRVCAEAITGWYSVRWCRLQTQISNSGLVLLQSIFAIPQPNRRLGTVSVWPCRIYWPKRGPEVGLSLRNV